MALYNNTYAQQYQFATREQMLQQIDDAQSIDDIREILKVCVKHAFSNHYQSSIDEPKY